MAMKNSIKQLKLRNTGTDRITGRCCMFYVCMLLKTNIIQFRAISNIVEPRNQTTWNIELAITNLNASFKSITQ